MTFLEPLADPEVREFAFIVLPLKLIGATGSTVRADRARRSLLGQALGNRCRPPTAQYYEPANSRLLH